MVKITIRCSFGLALTPVVTLAGALVLLLFSELWPSLRLSHQTVKVFRAGPDHPILLPPIWPN